MPSSKDSQLIAKIFTFSRFFKEQMRYQAGILHLSLLQIQTLLFLLEHPSIQMGDLASFFSIEMPTATNLINKLVREDLVSRQQDKEDRRLVRILLTGKGKELLENVMKERNKKLSQLLSFLSTKDKDNLLRIISILTDTMEKSHEK